MALKDTFEVEELPIMRVACTAVESRNPEVKAFETLIDWSKKNKLKDTGKIRFFGFNDPCPEPGQKVYKYEAWMTVGEDVAGTEGISIRTHQGGSYAVMLTPLSRIEEAWDRLTEAVKRSRYKVRPGVALEEALANPIETPFEKAHIKLYLPVEMTKPE